MSIIVINGATRSAAQVAAVRSDAIRQGRFSVLYLRSGVPGIESRCALDNCRVSGIDVGVGDVSSIVGDVAAGLAGPLLQSSLPSVICRDMCRKH